MNPDASGNDLDRPFEQVDEEPMFDAADAVLCGGVVVLATVVEVPELGRRPALVFRFALATGGFRKPVLLVLDDEQMAKTEDLIVAAISAAREAASP